MALVVMLLTLLTHFEQMSMEQRLQAWPRQNSPNLEVMQEKQSRPWETDTGRPWGTHVTFWTICVFFVDKMLKDIRHNPLLDFMA